MKRFILIATFFSFLAICAQAQNERRSNKRMTPEQIAERTTERMAEELKLSEDQKNKVYALQLEKATRNLEEMKTQRERRKAAHLEEQKKLDAILTPEQKAQLEAKRTELKEKRKQFQEGKRKFQREKRRDVMNKEDIS